VSYAVALGTRRFGARRRLTNPVSRHVPNFNEDVSTPPPPKSNVIRSRAKCRIDPSARSFVYPSSVSSRSLIYILERHIHTKPGPTPLFSCVLVPSRCLGRHRSTSHGHRGPWTQLAFFRIQSHPQTSIRFSESSRISSDSFVCYCYTRLRGSGPDC
jgi:hypothetical protein